MGREELASEVISELQRPIDQAVSKAHRRYGGAIERDDLRSQAIEAVLVFAGLMVPDQRSYRSRRAGDAGKLDAWRQLPARRFRTYLQHALDWWLSDFASHELEKRSRRLQTVSYEDVAPARTVPRNRRAAWLADVRSADEYDAVEMRLMLAEYPMLSLRYLRGMSIRAAAHHLRISMMVARGREAQEKELLRQGWQRDLSRARTARGRYLPIGPGRPSANSQQVRYAA